MKEKDNSEMLTGNHALLRRESFGGTLCFVQTGKRTYITHEEFSSIKRFGSIPPVLAGELGLVIVPVIVTEPAQLPKGNFSAPDTVFLEVTRACNLACTHCFNNSGKQLPNQLTQPQLETIIKDLAKSGVQEIRFTGGEPTTLPGIVPLIRHASSLGLRCSMGTNAVLIDETRASNFKTAGLHACITSLDGLEDRNNLIRGRSSFQLALEGIERLRAKNIEVRVNIVVMRSNLADIMPLVDILAQRNIPVFLRRLILSGRASSFSNEMLSAMEYNDLQIRLKQLLNDPRGIVDGHYLKERHVMTRIPLPFARKECSAGHRGLVVLPDGRIQTCGFLGPLNEENIGNLSIEPFSKVWERLNNSTYIQELECNLERYNNSTAGPKTNCLAVALSGQEPLIQIHSHTTKETSL